MKPLGIDTFYYMHMQGALEIWALACQQSDSLLTCVTHCLILFVYLTKLLSCWLQVYILLYHLNKIHVPLLVMVECRPLNQIV